MDSEKRENSPSNEETKQEIGLTGEQLIQALGGLGRLVREQAKAIELHQQAIELWGKRLQAVEAQVEEILRVIRRPGAAGIGSVN